MGYTVIHYFVDLQDSNHPYKVGDTFPRLGLVVSDVRLKELSSANNKQGKPLIEKSEEKSIEKNETTLTKTEINRMPLAELKELAKREGIDADEMKGGEIKTALIEKYNL
jgi:hypothetical protein